MKKLLFSVSILAILTACNSNQFESEIEVIDSLQSVLVKNDSVILALDTSEIYRRLNLQLDLLNKIQQEADSLSRNEAFILDEYSRYKKAYSRWGEKIPIFFNEINLRKNQLNDLKNDLENNHLDKEKAAIYLENEKEHVNDLSVIISDMNVGIRSIDSLYKVSQIRVDSIVSNLSHNTAQ